MGLSQSLEVFHLAPCFTRLSSLCRIGDAGTAAIARAFPPTLQELDLSNNELSAIGVADIANAMRDSVLSKLTILNLSGSDIGASGGAELGEVLGVCVPKLQQLDLRGCGMTSSGITWLSRAIPACEDMRAFFTLEATVLEMKR